MSPTSNGVTPSTGTSPPDHPAWDLAYAAHQFVPFQLTEGFADLGLGHRARPGRRAQSVHHTYGSPIIPVELVDLAAMRLLSIGAHIEARVRAEDPAFAVQMTGTCRHALRCAAAGPDRASRLQAATRTLLGW